MKSTSIPGTAEPQLGICLGVGRIIPNAPSGFANALTPSDTLHGGLGIIRHYCPVKEWSKFC